MSDIPEQSTQDQGSMTYQIRVEGLLGQHWTEWFEGMVITVNEVEGTSQLTGQVMDQAALYGLLRKVRDTGLSLKSVTRLDE